MTLGDENSLLDIYGLAYNLRMDLMIKLNVLNVMLLNVRFVLLRLQTVLQAILPPVRRS